MTTFKSLSALFDEAWEIHRWRGEANEKGQTLVIELRKRKPGKSATEVYHEGVAQ